MTSARHMAQSTACRVYNNDYITRNETGAQPPVPVIAAVSGLRWATDELVFPARLHHRQLLNYY
jgi:hypothetical protein